MEALFFEDWYKLGRVALTTVLAFITLFLFLRISGKRTLSRLNAFDFVVTIALGSTLSYMMLAMVPLLEGALVLLLIIMLQFLFAWGARLSRGMEKLINDVPRLLYYDGKFLKNAMAKEALTEEEIYAVIRASGINQLDDVKAVVMELNGHITVVKTATGSGKSSLDPII